MGQETVQNRQKIDFGPTVDYPWRRVNGGSNSGSLKVAKSSLAAATVLTMEYRARENSVTISGSLKVAENSLAFYEGQQLPQYY